MKFKEGDILFYVCPFTFIIEKVKVEIAFKESNSIYYVERTGGYLNECDLFADFNEAQNNALEKLDAFVEEAKRRIFNDKPSYEKEF